VSGLITWPVAHTDGDEGMARVTSHDIGAG